MVFNVQRGRCADRSRPAQFLFPCLQGWSLQTGWNQNTELFTSPTVTAKVVHKMFWGKSFWFHAKIVDDSSPCLCFWGTKCTSNTKVSGFSWAMWAHLHNIIVKAHFLINTVNSRTGWFEDKLVYVSTFDEELCVSTIQFLPTNKKSLLKKNICLGWKVKNTWGDQKRFLNDKQNFNT